MPELPEVETVRCSVSDALSGATFVRAEGVPIQMRRLLDPALISERISGRRLLAARRRGKYLLVDVDPPGTLLIHLGMSGRLDLTTPEKRRPPHTHLVLEVDDGRELRLVDPRRFGFAVWLEPGEEAADSSLARLGMEPLEPGFPARLAQLARSSRAAIKSVLLDQRLVAGVGNIYATEALWRVGIRPARVARSISVARLTRLGTAVQEVLEEAIVQGGTTLRDFATPDGGSGYFSVRLAVYGREGSPCPRCNRSLKRQVIGGRATAWCTRCQR